MLKTGVPFLAFSPPLFADVQRPCRLATGFPMASPSRFLTPTLTPTSDSHSSVDPLAFSASSSSRVAALSHLLPPAPLSFFSPLSLPNNSFTESFVSLERKAVIRREVKIRRRRIFRPDRPDIPRNQSEPQDSLDRRHCQHPRVSANTSFTYKARSRGFVVQLNANRARMTNLPRIILRENLSSEYDSTL